MTRPHLQAPLEKSDPPLRVLWLRRVGAALLLFAATYLLAFATGVVQ